MNQDLLETACFPLSKERIQSFQRSMPSQHATPSWLRRLRTQPRQGDHLLDFFLTMGVAGSRAEMGRQSKANLPAPVPSTEGGSPAPFPRGGGMKHATPPTSPPYPMPPPLRSQLDELCAAISENNPTCFELTWDFALEGCPQAVVKGGIGRKNVAQLVQLTMNLPLCSRKTPRRGSVPIYGVSRPSPEGRAPVRGASRATAGALPPLPRRNFLRRGDENAFFFGIGSSWTKIIDM